MVSVAGDQGETSPSLPPAQPVEGPDGQPTQLHNAAGVYAVYDSEDALQYVGMSRKVGWPCSRAAAACILGMHASQRDESAEQRTPPDRGQLSKERLFPVRHCHVSMTVLVPSRWQSALQTTDRTCQTGWRQWRCFRWQMPRGNPSQQPGRRRSRRQVRGQRTVRVGNDLAPIGFLPPLASRHAAEDCSTLRQ